MVTVDRTLQLCEVTASPSSIVALTTNVTLDPGINVQVTPSGDVNAVKVSPVRLTRTYRGTVCNTCEMRTVVPPCAARYCTTMPFPGVTNAAYSGDPGSVVARSITPAFAHALVFVCDVTRAVTVSGLVFGPNLYT